MSYGFSSKNFGRFAYRAVPVAPAWIARSKTDAGDVTSSAIIRLPDGVLQRRHGRLHLWNQFPALEFLVAGRSFGIPYSVIALAAAQPKLAERGGEGSIIGVGCRTSSIFWAFPHP
ncbi:hypothetical protein [Martelella sp. AMO21009]